MGNDAWRNVVRALGAGLGLLLLSKLAAVTHAWRVAAIVGGIESAGQTDGWDSLVGLSGPELTAHVLVLTFYATTLFALLIHATLRHATAARLGGVAHQLALAVRYGVPLVASACAGLLALAAEIRLVYVRDRRRACECPTVDIAMPDSFWTTLQMFVEHLWASRYVASSILVIALGLGLLRRASRYFQRAILQSQNRGAIVIPD